MSDRSARARRPNGAGSIGVRSDGALTVRATGPDGKRHKRIVTKAVRPDGRPETPSQHRRRAETALAALHKQLAEPSSLRERWTLTKYFEQRYLPSLAERLRERTVEDYANAWRLFVAPHVGHVELAKLTVDDVDQLDRTLASKGYGVAIRRKARGCLNRVMRHAVSKRRVQHNPCSDADRLATDDRDRTRGTLQPEEVNALLRAAAGTEWAVPIGLMALLGLRRGEVCGLAWSCVDLDASTLRVERSMATLNGGRLVLGPCKTAGSRRSLRLSPQLVAALRAHRARQAEWRLQAGGHWQDTFVDDRGEAVQLVLTDEAGRPLPPHRVNDGLDRAALAGRVGKVNPHLLRHSAASVMLSEGMDIPSVAAVLGHASPAVTMSVYAHAIGRGVSRATAAISDAVGEW